MQSGGTASAGGHVARELLANTVELVVVLEVDDDFASAFGGNSDFDLGSEGVPQLLLQGHNLVAGGSLMGSRAGEDISVDSIVRAALLADDPFHLADAEAIFFDPLGERNLIMLITQRQ